MKSKTTEKPYLTLTTKGECVLSSKDDVSVDKLQPSMQEGFDTRIFLHLKDAADKGQKIAKIRTVDTDIVVIAISLFNKLTIFKLWVGFGSGKSYRDIPIHSIHELLGPEKCAALPVFHAITGCDYTSAFRNIGKKTAWKTWEEMPSITQTFLAMKKI